MGNWEQKPNQNTHQPKKTQIHIFLHRINHFKALEKESVRS